RQLARLADERQPSDELRLAQRHREQEAQRRHRVVDGRHAGAARHQVQLIADRKSTRLNSSHVAISYAVFCLKKKKTYQIQVLCTVLRLPLILDNVSIYPLVPFK